MGFLGEISLIWSTPFLLEEAGVCLAEPNNDIFNFENGYIVPYSSHKGFSVWEKKSFPFFPS